MAAAMDTADLRKVDKQDLIEVVRRVGARAKKVALAQRERAERVLDIAVAAGTAGAVGYYMGMLERDNPGDEDAQLIFGLPPDLIVGVGLAGVGMIGEKYVGKRVAHYSTAGAIGALSLYAGNKARQYALESE